MSGYPKNGGTYLQTLLAILPWQLPSLKEPQQQRAGRRAGGKVNQHGITAHRVFEEREQASHLIQACLILQFPYVILLQDFDYRTTALPHYRPGP